MEPVAADATEIILDENIPFSRSTIWEYQRDFYFQQNINAWARKVPFYITSNPYIANSYATVIIRFIQDCRKNNEMDPGKPFYVVELAAGSGTFSFYLIKRLFELRRSLAVNVRLVYVMTDLVEQNINYWRQHKAFQSFIDTGELDFAHFDAEASTEISLLNSGITLQPEKSKSKKNPFVFIANYCFDSLRTDVFRILDNKLLEGLCKLTTERSNLKEGKVDELNKVKVAFSFEEASLPYYQHDVLNKILLHYLSTAEGQYISFPIGSLMCIKSLMEIAGNRLLLISSDKGYSKHLEHHQSEAPGIVFHDNCFSVSVNFDAFKQYFKLSGGDSFNQFTEQALTTCAFTSGFKFSALQETSLALHTSLNAFGHSTINSLFLNYNFTSNLSDIESILPFLGAIGWDAGAFNSCRDIIVNQIRNGYARISDLEDLKEKMSQIEENVYMLPQAIDTFFDIGLFYQETLQHALALAYYEKSIRHFGEKDVTLYNMGLCYHFMKKPNEAIEKFSQALVHNPSYILARGWISQIQDELRSSRKKSKNANGNSIV